MHRRIVEASFVVLLALLAAGCGGDDDTASTAPAGEPTDEQGEQANTGAIEEPEAEPEPAPTATPAPTPAPEPTATSEPTATPEPSESFATMSESMQGGVDRLCTNMTEAASRPLGSPSFISDVAPLTMQVGEAGETLEPFGAPLGDALAVSTTLDGDLLELVDQIVAACTELGWSEGILAATQPAVDPDCELVITNINAVGRVQDDQSWADYFSELSGGELDTLLERLRVGRNIETGQVNGNPVMGTNPDWDPAITELRAWREAWSAQNC